MSTELPDKLKEFYTHWASLPKEGQVPSLREFLSLPSPEFQPYCAIYDVVDGGKRLPLRLFGTGLVSFNGGDLTGKDFLMSAEPELRDTISFTARTQVEFPCGRTDLRRLSTTQGKNVDTEALSLPLATDEGKPSCIVLYLQYNETVGYGETLESMMEMRGIRWVDVGAGVPDQEPADIK